MGEDREADDRSRLQGQPFIGGPTRCRFAMAVGNFSPSGFSYAQAARGTAPASQTSSSKVTSGAATPANSISLEASGGNWADDVEENEGPKDAPSQKQEQEDGKMSLPKDSAVDRTKAEDKLLNGVSGVSSPDTTGSSTASTATRDDSPSAPTGSSSDITWETKSQASEPSWIAERKERQNGSHGSDSTPKSGRKGKKNAEAAKEPKEPKEEPKPIVLTEAAPPTVNPWARRAEEAKAKAVITPKPAPTPASATPVQKENQQPAPSSQRKPNSTSTTQRESIGGADAAPKPTPPTNGKRPNEVRINNRQNSKPSTGESGSARASTPQSRSLPNMSSNLPSVKDEISWPTVETAAQEKERKESHEKDSEEKRDDESTPTAKPKKQEWTPMVVTPNVIWETQSMNEPKERKPRAAGGERGGRGGARGRGSLRGGAVNGGDRNAGRSSPALNTGDVEQASKGLTNAGERSNTLDSTKQNGNTPAERTNSIEAAPRAANAKDASAQVEAGQTTESRRTRSPKKTSPSQATEKDEVATPAPIPRQPSIAAQNTDSSDKSRSDPPVRMVATENRKESRNGDVFRDPSWTGAPRGSGKRGGRGRGGHGTGPRDLPNGHAYGGNFQNDYNGPPTFGVPPSPSGYPRGNHHQYGYPPAGSNRGGWARGGPRSHSIPVDSYYPRYGHPQYGNAPGQMPNINTYMPPFSEYGQMPPMSAIMPSPQEAQDHLLMMVTMQLEYYFGVENLIRDVFMRKHMDSQGFVFLDFIAGFNRLKQLTTDKDLLKTACLNSEFIEILIGEDGKERLRKREGWQQFIRPVEERDPSAQTEGPQQLQRPERPQLSMPAGSSHFQGPYSAGLPAMHQRMNHRSYDSGMPMMNGFAPHFVPNGDFHGSVFGDSANGEEMRGRPAKSPIYENGDRTADRSFTSEGDASIESDVFPDEQVSALGIVVRMSEQPPPYHSAASRTFSNGSIDSRSIAAELDKPSESGSPQLPNGGPQVNGDTKMPPLSRHLSPSKARSPEQGPPNVEREVCWAKDVNNIPEGTTYEQYTQLRLKALDQRNHAATGNCPYDLDILYQFWCHFLCRNFNNRMYGEFRYFALSDARERHSLTGVNNLLKFYAHSLNSFDSIRDRVVKDYVQLVKDEPPALEGMAFKQLRSAWRNGALNLKNRKKLSDVLDEQLKTALDKSEA